jgi:hypothetical protein
MNRRHVLLSAGALATIVALPALAASPPTELQVFKSPTCGCCGAWVEHMRAAGFSVKVTEVDDTTAALAIDPSYVKALSRRVQVS